MDLMQKPVSFFQWEMASIKGSAYTPNASLINSLLFVSDSSSERPKALVSTT